MTPYEILGVPKEASPDEIRIAFRRAASEAHPDRQGGDGERMAQVNEAYAVLGDPARRKRFDETGSTQQAPSIEVEAMQALATVFKAALDQDSHGVVEFARLATAQSRQQIAAARSQASAKKEKLSKKRPNVRVKGEAANIVHALIDAQIGALAKQVESLDRAQLVADAVAELLEAYEEDALPPQWRPVFSTFGSGTGNWG